MVGAGDLWISPEHDVNPGHTQHPHGPKCCGFPYTMVSGKVSESMIHLWMICGNSQKGYCKQVKSKSQISGK